MRKVIKNFLILIIFFVWLFWTIYYSYWNNNVIKQTVDILLKQHLNITVRDLNNIMTIHNTNSEKNHIELAKELDDLTKNSLYDLYKIVWEKNETIKSFTKSKNLLFKEIYNWKTLDQFTYYCWCKFTNLKKINSFQCWFKNNWKYESRSKKLEWEHIVPAENFWQSFKSWRDWNSACIDSKWKKFKGRNCARKVDENFRYMEADMYNLVPSIGSINAIRSNYQIAEIEWEATEFWKCDVEIKDRKFEPSENIKWDIARIYLYMNSAYKGRWIISNKNKKLIEFWNKIDPIDKAECNRYKAIKKIQKNDNIILSKKCKEI